ncbi:MAG: radical SAM protein [Actinomycetota bacterium]|nr:radical SAM protein [Actinomycetota bacterium]
MILKKIKQLSYFIGFKIKNTFNRKYKKPLLAGIKITTKCNMRCTHCPFWRKNNGLSMSWDVFKKSVKKLYDLGARILIIEGGEPMLWNDRKYGKDIGDAISFAKKYFFYTAITTNGSINFNNINPDIIFVSIESAGENYSKIRNYNIENILANLKNVKDKKIIINITITSLTYKDVVDSIKFLNKFVYGFTLQFFYPYEGLDDLKLTASQRKNILDDIIQLKKQGFKILDSYDALRKMSDNSWKCNDFLVSSVEADGKINNGCYLKDRALQISCKDCGFFAHCELSLAFQLNIGALWAAKKIFMD